MKARHQAPSIFNLSMVDILCCALGCVILLWLVKQRDADQQAADSMQVASELRATRERLTGLLEELEKNKEKQATLVTNLDKARQEGSRLQNELKSTQSNLSNVMQSRSDLQKQIEEDRKNRLRLEALLAQRLKDLEQTNNELKKFTALLLSRQKTIAKLNEKAKNLDAELEKAKKDGVKVTELEKQMRQTKENLKKELSESEKLQQSVKTFEQQLAERNKALLQMQDAKAKAEKEATENQQKLKTTMVRVTELERQLLAQARSMSISGQKVSDLQKERDYLILKRRELEQKHAKLERILEQRFAGIELTGRRVIFLVDTSGSMRLLEDGKPATGKWKRVQDALSRIMQSLPALEKFQLVTFAEKTTFPLVNEGRWIDFEGVKSIEQAVAALAKIQPEGGTDLHQALQATFRYRNQGLDTIYLLSDGLPNIGEGVSDEEKKRLSQTEISNRMAKYIRSKLKSEWNVASASQPKVRIHGVGFFFESPDVGAFLWALARENEGSFVGMSKP